MIKVGISGHKGPNGVMISIFIFSYQKSLSIIKIMLVPFHIMISFLSLVVLLCHQSLLAREISFHCTWLYYLSHLSLLSHVSPAFVATS
jgi:hypothetical protein